MAKKRINEVTSQILTMTVAMGSMPINSHTMKPKVEKLLEKHYSSETVKVLLENNMFSFWKKDWSHRISVKWDSRVPLKKFRKQIVELVGEGFIYERSLTLSEDKKIFVAAIDGLKELKAFMA